MLGCFYMFDLSRSVVIAESGTEARPTEKQSSIRSFPPRASGLIRPLKHSEPPTEVRGSLKKDARFGATGAPARGEWPDR
jgi:hypothetical protein